MQEPEKAQEVPKVVVEVKDEAKARAVKRGGGGGGGGVRGGGAGTGAALWCLKGGAPSLTLNKGFEVSLGILGAKSTYGSHHEAPFLFLCKVSSSWESSKLIQSYAS